ncbi:MAG: S8 family serine peptidase [Oscillospiraceae bacterium]|nr:S8 family serine peptidase [Oscillospiraceae bacterium]
MMNKGRKRYIALLLAVVLLATTVALAVTPTEPPVYQDAAAAVLTQSLQPAVGAQGFADGWDDDPNELIEIAVQFVTPSSVALRLAQEEQAIRSRSAHSYEEQAQMGHDAFWAQMEPFTRLRTAQIDTLSEHHTLLNGVFLRVPVHMVEQIAALPEVFAVTPNEVQEEERELDSIVEHPASGIDPFSADDPLMRGIGELFNLEHIHNEMGITGVGVRVAVLDDGVTHNHPRLVPFQDPETGRIRGWNFIDNNDDPARVPGEGGHGMLVTGPIIAIAPDIELWHFRVNRSDQHAVLAIEMAYQEGIHVVNRSEYPPRGYFGVARYVMNLAVLDGMIITHSAGNQGALGTRPFSVHASGLYITVGAGQAGNNMMNHWRYRDGIHGSSSRGPSPWSFHINPDIIAPGSSQTTTGAGGGYITASGTSLSAPSIAGVAALMVEAFPDAPPYEIQARMMNTARQLSVEGDNSVFNIGAGFVRPYYALTSEAFATVQREIPWGEEVESSGRPLIDPTLFREVTVSSLSFGAIIRQRPETEALTVTIHNPGEGTWVPEVRFNSHLRDHSGVSMNLTRSGTRDGVQTFTYQMTFADGVPRGAYEGNLVFMNAAQAGRVISVPFGAYFGVEPPAKLSRWENHDFGAVPVGYSVSELPPALSVTATRTDPGRHADLVRIFLCGPNPDSFTLDVEHPPWVYMPYEGDRDYIMIRPKADLPVGTHTATVRMFRWFFAESVFSFNVSFTVVPEETYVHFHTDGTGRSGDSYIAVPVTLDGGRMMPDTMSAAWAEVLDIGHIYGTAEAHGYGFWGWFEDGDLVRSNPRGRRPALVRAFGAWPPPPGACLDTLAIEGFDLAFFAGGNADIFGIWFLWGDVNDDDRVCSVDILWLNRFLHDRLFLLINFPIWNVQINPLAADVFVRGQVSGSDILQLERSLHDRFMRSLGLPPVWNVVLGEEPG